MFVPPLCQNPHLAARDGVPARAKAHGRVDAGAQRATTDGAAGSRRNTRETNLSERVVVPDCRFGRIAGVALGARRE